MHEDINALRAENARLKSAIRELSVLNEISGMLGSTLPLEEVSQRIIKKVVQALQAKEAAIFTFSDESGQQAHTFVRGKLDSASMSRTRLDNSITGWIALYKKPLTLNDAETDQRFQGIQFGDSSISSLVAVPLIAKGKLIGALAVFNSLKPGRFTEEDVRMLSIIGVQSAQSLENARLYVKELELKEREGELTTAKKIQEGFLPKCIPALAGFEICGGTIPAKEVGGDYYDFVPLAENRIYFTIGDVSGKGVPAALLMTMIQGQGRLLISRDLSISPARALEELNVITCQLSGEAQFATMIIGRLDSDEITLANGGHGYPLIVRQNGDIEEITESSMLIGMFPQAKFSDVSARLAPGDSVILASDGVDEAMNEATDHFGFDRLRDVLRNCRDRHASEIHSCVIDAVIAFRGKAPQSDDITLIVIKRM